MPGCACAGCLSLCLYIIICISIKVFPMRAASTMRSHVGYIRHSKQRAWYSVAISRSRPAGARGARKMGYVVSIVSYLRARVLEAHHNCFGIPGPSTFRPLGDLGAVSTPKFTILPPNSILPVPPPTPISHMIRYWTAPDPESWSCEFGYSRTNEEHTYLKSIGL